MEERMTIRDVFRTAQRQAELYVDMFFEHHSDRDWEPAERIAYEDLCELECYAAVRARGGRPGNPCVTWVSEEYWEANCED